MGWSGGEIVNPTLNDGCEAAHSDVYAYQHYTSHTLYLLESIHSNSYSDNDLTNPLPYIEGLTGPCAEGGGW